MFTYKIKILDTINESVNRIPSVITYKNKNKIDEKAVFEKAKSFVNKKYGVILESADIILVKEGLDDDWRENEWAHRNTYPKYSYEQKDIGGNTYAKEEVDALNAWNSFIHFIQDESNTEYGFDEGMEGGPDGAEGIIEFLDEVISRAERVKQFTLKAYGKYM